MTDDKKQNKSLWYVIKIRLEPIGIALCIVGILLLVSILFIPNVNDNLHFNLLGISFGLLSVGLGMIAIGISAKSDKRYTDILTRIDTNVGIVLEQYKSEDKIDIPLETTKNIVITPPAAHLKIATGFTDVTGRFEVITPEESKKRAQARLDADTTKVGYVRGELIQKDDGSWAIHWGGKYPL